MDEGQLNKLKQYYQGLSDFEKNKYKFQVILDFLYFNYKNVFDIDFLNEKILDSGVFDFIDFDSIFNPKGGSIFNPKGGSTHSIYSEFDEEETDVHDMFNSIIKEHDNLKKNMDIKSEFNVDKKHITTEKEQIIIDEFMKNPNIISILSDSKDLLIGLFNGELQETCKYLCKKDWKKYLMGSCKKMCVPDKQITFIIRKLLQKFLKLFLKIVKINRKNKKKLLDFVNAYRIEQSIGDTRKVNSPVIFIFSYVFYKCVDATKKHIDDISNRVSSDTPRDSMESNHSVDSVSSAASTVRWGGTRRKLKTRRKFKYTRR